MGALDNLGKNIAACRKKAGITQEQLAEQLCVSVSAVSQWETGKTFPDLSAIPVLCRVLGVTSDELLDIDREKDAAQIQEINAEANRLMGRGHETKAEKLLTDALKRYPNSYELMRTKMYLEYSMGVPKYFTGVENEEERAKSRKHYEKCIALAQKILEGCKDMETVYSARQILCYAYGSIGEDEKAIAIAMEMPRMSICQESMLSSVSKGRKKYENRQYELFMLLQDLCVILDTINVRFEDGSFPYSPAEDAAIKQKIIDVMAIMFEDHDYGFFHDALMRANLHIARIVARHEQDAKKVLLHLKQAADHAEAFIQNREETLHTSLLMRGSDYGTFSTNDEANNPAQVLRDMQDERFDFIREEPEFKALEERLKKTAGKWG